MSDEKRLRRGIVETCRRMNASGLNQGTSGNVSARLGELMLITPTGVPYDEMAPEDVAAMPLSGEYGSWAGPLAPSSEWRFHLDIMRARPEVGAIVHAHSTYATTLAIARKGDPGLPLHDRRGGRPLDPLRRLCHLRHEGALDGSPGGARGPDLLPPRQSRHDRHRCHARQGDVAGDRARDHRPAILSCPSAIGGPVLLSDAEIEHVKERFKSYGPRPKSGAANDEEGATGKGKKRKKVG